MIKMVCDRCGKEVPCAVLPHTCKITMMNGINRKEYDLCKECLFKVKNFITDAIAEQTEQKGADDE